ncbi:MAG: hypothetical protein US62_C0032G0005 [Candidatus Woesebacteria bacterium GW2011_GWA1_37_8]|uniref:Uncharacterized protein n=2 Tax=Candidatus Woeseibacteriota TaxID=1752722 RepID=A0A0G0PDB5_9BACT|nr:MAG: hypothetical protein US39_C0001G0124 [Microgenomates group bacterium GW2011_GWC1_37_12b]KKQ44121.1 MAG: hypothetical protein US62_C0032G0005 [Candidatus Woesebacteria bacterium GW2011_GWA1_37_8]KKQ87276.1 MAG: hypothetical protein UT10_C0008G0037 [Candidatus Woesebacteria bacterium GW2011_GWB1_38_8b]
MPTGKTHLGGGQRNRRGAQYIRDLGRLTNEELVAKYGPVDLSVPFFGTKVDPSGKNLKTKYGNGIVKKWHRNRKIKLVIKIYFVD